MIRNSSSRLDKNLKSVAIINQHSQQIFTGIGPQYSFYAYIIDHHRYKETCLRLKKRKNCKKNKKKVVKILNFSVNFHKKIIFTKEN